MGLFEFLFGDSGNQIESTEIRLEAKKWRICTNLDGMKWKILNMTEKL